jgi:hypothetical protein
MDRRDVLGLLGATAAGLSAGLPGQEARGADPPGHRTPADECHLYLCAFHIAKKDPKFQVEAHHYCSPVNDEVHQCIIFDTNGKNARILGVEYIISDRLYRTLPDAEKKYYHPHTYEVLSGLLVAPGMPEADESSLLKTLVTTWGKTWHTWPDPKTALPMGEPLLMWAHTKDGQIDPGLLADRDRRLGISTARVRSRRAGLGPVPQVDPPKSVDEIGRQWTNDGPDEPRRK